MPGNGTYMYGRAHKNMLLKKTITKTDARAAKQKQ